MKDNKEIKAEEALNDDEIDTVAGGINTPKPKYIEPPQEPVRDTIKEVKGEVILTATNAG